MNYPHIISSNKCFRTGRKHKILLHGTLRRPSGVGGNGVDCLRRIRDWQEVGRAHGEVFGAIRPTTAMVEVSRLINAEMLVEIEAEAIVADSVGRNGTARVRRSKKKQIPRR